MDPIIHHLCLVDSDALGTYVRIKELGIGSVDGLVVDKMLGVRSMLSYIVFDLRFLRILDVRFVHGDRSQGEGSMELLLVAVGLAMLLHVCRASI